MKNLSKVNGFDVPSDVFQKFNQMWYAAVTKGEQTKYTDFTVYTTDTHSATLYHADPGLQAVASRNENGTWFVVTDVNGDWNFVGVTQDEFLKA